MSIKELEKISFASKVDNIRIAEGFIESKCTEYNIGEEVFPNILLATTEAVNNAIVHGNKLNNKIEVELMLLKENDAIHITVTDRGNGFDYLNLPDPTAPENLEKEHGRGVFMMRSLADDVEFERGGSTVVLKFLLK